LVQGLALGGEYGGAATYVAEHAPANRRGFWTSWIQTTATLGLFLALGVIIMIRSSQGVEAFSAEWGGWRYPFWISIVLVVISILIRMKMSESPMFSKLKSEGKTSTNPLKESFGHKANFKMVLLALFGAVMGQGVIWYTGQFYAQSFIETVCKVEFVQSRNLMLWAILFATPFFVVFGYLSDRVGRKWIMMIGMLAGILTYRPIYQHFLDVTSAKNRVEKIDLANTVVAEKLATVDAKDQTKLFIVQKIDTAYTDGAKFSYTKTDTLHLVEPIADANAGLIQYTKANLTDSSKVDTVLVKLKPTKEASLDATKVALVKMASISAKPNVVVEKTLDESTYWNLIWLVFVQILYVTMVYGPIAAFLVELFPTKIRYTSMSLPYHIGNGVFGGLVPFLGTLIVEFTKTADKPAGDPLAGLWYPIGVAAICLFIGVVYLSNKVDKEVMD
jgi:MFS family permease